MKTIEDYYGFIETFGHDSMKGYYAYFSLAL